MTAGMSFLIPRQLGRINTFNQALSMKYSICNIQLLPKAADLRKKAFDEFRLNMLIVLLQLLSRKNATKSWLTSSSFLIPSFPGPRVFSTQWFIV